MKKLLFIATILAIALATSYCSGGGKDVDDNVAVSSISLSNNTLELVGGGY